jgi:hypothetical protein
VKNNFVMGLAAIPSDPAAAITTREMDDDGGKVQLIIRLHPDTRRAMKHLAAAGDTSIQKLMEEAIADLLVKYRTPLTR